MTKRMMAALVALAGLFIALYLTLYKLGVIGQITCSIGSCETVQTSRWATLLGLPVAAWGVGYYLSVLAVTIAGSTDRWADSRTVSLLLLALTGWGALFSLWLTYLELFVIDAICQWCVANAIVATALAAVVVADFLGSAEGEGP